MIIKTGLNNLNCLVLIEKIKDKYFYIDHTKNVCKEILKEDLEHCMRIPMTDHIRALNLSNSVAIMVYEVLRQQDYRNLLKSEPFKGENYLSE